ncbi:hypothetical protein Bca4012_039914 [Brassica carinata]
MSTHKHIDGSIKPRSSEKRVNHIGHLDSISTLSVIFPYLRCSKAKPHDDDDDEATVRLKSKQVHVVWDWNNAPLPSGYDMSTLFTKIQQGLQKLDPALTINTVVASGDLHTLGVDDTDAESRYQILENDHRVKTFKVASRQVTCDTCLKSFARCNHEEDDDEFYKSSSVDRRFCSHLQMATLLSETDPRRRSFHDREQVKDLELIWQRSK